ncbi:hypothetical protein ABTK12_19720, partial [Acinetobacter baumannii]
NPWFIAFTLVVALMLDMIPLGRVAAMPDVLAVVLVPVFFVVVRRIFKGSERQRRLDAAHRPLDEEI